MQRHILLWLCCGFASIVLAAGAPPVPTFENQAEASTASGYLKLSWELDVPDEAADNYVFELQQAQSPDFTDPRVIYQGPDYATFLSGLENGAYYHRVRASEKGGAGPSEWSDTQRVTVKHHSLRLALALFGLGLLVFLLTVGIVVVGNRATSSN